ncbi:MAG: hypothetical protein ACRDA4_10525 [Filifactoraceae bacterium]
MDAFIIKGLVDIDVTRVGPALNGVSMKANATALSMQRLGKNLMTFGSTMGKFGTMLTTSVTLPIVGIGVASAMAYSDLNEALSKSQQVFDETADVVKDWSKSLVKSHGVAQGQALATASTYGAMGKSMGLEKDNVDLYAMSLTELASDMSSFHNTRIDIAQTALNSIYTGETESLKQFGIVMTEANLEQFALNQGINKSIDEMSQAEKVQLRYAFVMANSRDVMGDFERTNDGLANKMRILTARIKETAEKIGDKLEPLFTRIVDKTISLTEAIGNLSEEQLESIIKFAGMVAVMGPVLLVFGKIFSAVGWIVGKFSQLSAAVALAGGWGKYFAPFITFLTGPVGIAIAVITALIGTITLLYNKSEKFRETLQNTFGKLMEFLNQIKESCKWIWSLISDEVSVAWDYIYGILTNFWNLLVTFFDTQFKIIGDGFSFWTSLLKGDWEGCWNAIKDLVKHILTGIKDWFKNILDIMLKLVGSNYEEFKAKTKELISKLIEFFKNLPSNIATKFQEMKTAVINKIIEMKDYIVSKFQEIKIAIAEKIQEIINNIVTWFQTLPYRIGQAIGEVIKFFYDLGVSIYTWATVDLPGYIQSIILWFVNMREQIKLKIQEVFLSILNLGISIWTWITVDLPLIIQGIVNWFAQLPGRIWTWLVQTITNIINWGINLKNQAVLKVQETIAAIIQWFQGLPGRIWTWLNETINKVIQWGVSMKAKATENIKGFINNIVNPIKELSGKLYNMGIDMIKGLWNGIKSMAGELLGNVTGFFGDIIAGAKDVLGIKSPSRVMRDEVGVWMAKGVGEGFEEEERNVNLQIQRSLSRTVDFQRDDMPRPNKPGSNPISTIVNFNGPINDPIENSRKIDNLMKDLAYSL